ncbi:hypothetical protein CYY_002801 [Polysphondylium violaceum]|uniref:Phosducin domain-containing protein n=1 Tax=Polysphondylium violaceum TaxID=133409 RepID=A0A8J4PY93_9MYCE|nr:hypothetical protein CYY_002801 [Polysphondylium violaceum]
MSTEWEDIQRKFGNLPPSEFDIHEKQLEQLIVARAEQQIENEKTENKLANKTLEQLDQLEDEYNDDDEDEKILQEYRRKRIHELTLQKQQARYGDVVHVRANEYVEQVTNQSLKHCVVVLLFSSGLESQVLEQAFRVVSKKFVYVKFVSCDAQEITKGFPASHIPSVLVYKDGKCAHQFLGINSLGGIKLSPDDIEWHLSTVGVVETDLEEPPSTTKQDRIFINVQRVEKYSPAA